MTHWLSSLNREPFESNFQELIGGLDKYISISYSKARKHTTSETSFGVILEDLKIQFKEDFLPGSFFGGLCRTGKSLESPLCQILFVETDETILIEVTTESARSPNGLSVSKFSLVSWHSLSSPKVTALALNSCDLILSEPFLADLAVNLVKQGPKSANLTFSIEGDRLAVILGSMKCRMRADLEFTAIDGKAALKVADFYLPVINMKFPPPLKTWANKTLARAVENSNSRTKYSQGWFLLESNAIYSVPCSAHFTGIEVGDGQIRIKVDTTDSPPSSLPLM